MSSNSNYIVLYEGLKIFRDAMLAFIVEQLKSVYGENWWEQGVARCFEAKVLEEINSLFRKRNTSLVIERPGNEIAEVLDVGQFGLIIGKKHNWNNVFRNIFGDNNKSKILTWLDEIREVRNPVAHPQTGDLRTDDAIRGLDNADRILRLIKSDAAHEIQRLKGLLVSTKTGQEASLPQLDSNTRWQEYCRNLITAHQNWTSMPLALYLSPEQMDIVPARVVAEEEQFKEFKLQFIPKIENALKDFESVVIKGALRGLLESSSSETKDLVSLVDASDHPIVLLGNPGLGKSVAMERLALKYAERYLQSPTEYVPVLIRLRDYNNRKRDLLNLVRVTLQGQGLPLSETDTEELLRAEKLLLLFDGMDEAPKDSDILPELETFIQQYPHHRYVISSRLNVYRASYNRIIKCREVELQELTSEEAARLWHSFVEAPSFDDLPEKVQYIFRVPLFLRLCTKIPQPLLVRVKTEVQLMEVISRTLSAPLKLPSKNRELIEQCLFRLALEESYALDRARVFEVVTEYLSNEPKSYQQEIMTALLEHPLLISTSDHVLFWHSSFKDHFAAQGLREKLFAKDSAGSDLHFLNDRRWDNTVIDLAQLLDEARLIRLIEYLLLDFDNPILALRCIRELPTPLERVIQMVIDGLATNIVSTVEEILLEVPLDRIAAFLIARVVKGYTPTDLSEPKLTKLLLYIEHLRQAITDFELPTEAYLEHYLQDELLSQEAAHYLIGLYWLYDHLGTSDITLWLMLRTSASYQKRDEGG